MDYIYDIVLNFQDDYYEFYEWQHQDKIINIKKIPIIKISNNDYLNIKYNEVTIETSNLPKEKMFLITNSIEVMGVILNKNGNIIKKSSLIFEESDDILENLNIKHITKIIYIKNNKKSNNILSRISKEKIDYLNNYFKNINKEKDKYLLKYIYYDLFQKEESNIDKIYDFLTNIESNNLNEIYECIKKIAIEFKN